MTRFQKPSAGSLSTSEMVPVDDYGNPIGEHHARACYTDREIELVRELWAEGMTKTEIARKMEMPKSTVWAICTDRLRSTTPSNWVRRKTNGEP